MSVKNWDNASKYQCACDVEAHPSLMMKEKIISFHSVNSSKEGYLILVPSLMEAREKDLRLGMVD